MRERSADIAQVAGLVARRNVQAPAQSYGQMSEITTHALGLGNCPRRRSGGPCRLVSESDVPMDEIADRLHTLLSEGRGSELAPGLVGQQIGIAVPAPLQVHERVGGKILHHVLNDLARGDGIGRFIVPNDCLRSIVKRPIGATRRLHQFPKKVCDTPSPEQQHIGLLGVTHPREMYIQQSDDRRHLRQIEGHAASDTDPHQFSCLEGEIRAVGRAYPERHRSNRSAPTRSS